MQDAAVSLARDPFQLPPDKERTLTILCGDKRCALQDIIKRYETVAKIAERTESEKTAFEAGKLCSALRRLHWHTLTILCA